MEEKKSKKEEHSSGICFKAAKLELRMTALRQIFLL
jgi:hypothetical protein